MASWRQMSEDDIEGVMAVADSVHPDLPEDREVFLERLRLFPRGCLVLPLDGKICGYAVSHPTRYCDPPALNHLIGELPSNADQYYIHDLAILPERRGQGSAAKCILEILAIGEAYPTIGLVSVYGTSSFWKSFNFAATPVDENLAKKLQNYGDDAAFLMRRNGI